MPTTAKQVKEVGGLNDANAFLAFFFADVAELNTAINNSIVVAASWLKTRLPSGIYTSSDTDIQNLLSLAEAYLALHFLMPHLKARKVTGRHFAFESEDSDRYEELIDVEYLKLAQDLLGEWLTIAVEDRHFARPRMRVGPVIDPNDVSLESVEEELAETLDRARSLTVNLP